MRVSMFLFCVRPFLRSLVSSALTSLTLPPSLPPSLNISLVCTALNLTLPPSISIHSSLGPPAPLMRTGSASMIWEEGGGEDDEEGGEECRACRRAWGEGWAGCLLVRREGGGREEMVYVLSFCVWLYMSSFYLSVPLSVPPSLPPSLLQAWAWVAASLLALLLRGGPPKKPSRSSTTSTSPLKTCTRGGRTRRCGSRRRCVCPPSLPPSLPPSWPAEESRAGRV